MTLRSAPFKLKVDFPFLMEVQTFQHRLVKRDFDCSFTPHALQQIMGSATFFSGVDFESRLLKII
jgi:hypothetical protein